MKTIFFICHLSAIVKEIVELALFLQHLESVVVADVLVIYVHNRKVAGASLCEDSLAILSFEDIHRDPGLEIRALVNFLVLEKSLKIEHITTALGGTGSGREEHDDLALTTKGNLLEDIDAEHTTGNVLTTQCDMHLVISRLVGSVRARVGAIAILGDGGRRSAVVRTNNLDHQWHITIGRDLDSERSQIALDTLHQTFSVGTGQLRGVDASLLGHGISVGREISDHGLLVHTGIVHLVGGEHSLDTKVILTQTDTLGAVALSVIGIEVTVTRAASVLDSVVQSAQSTSVVPVLLKVLDVILGNLAAHPLQEGVLGLGKVQVLAIHALTDLVVINDRPNQTQSQLNASLFNVTGANVHQLDALVTEELQGNLQALSLLDGDSGMLVVATADGFGVGDNFQQMNEVQAILPVSLKIVDFAAAVLEVVVAPTSEGLLFPC